MKGIIKIPVADLRREPSFNSERVSQALFNTPVELEQENENYISATLPDGYKGWMYKSHLHYPVAAASGGNLKVSVPWFPVYSSDKKNKIIILPFSASVRIFKKSGGWLHIGSDAGQMGWAKKEGLMQPDKIRFSAPAFIKKGMEFMGSPYLWGGISPFGFDCSGFLFTLFDFYDKKIPRDTSEQIKAGFEVPFAKAKPGDLFFFPGHVALYAGKNKILHANLRGGGVTLDSIRKTDRDYNPVMEKLIVVKRFFK